MSRFAKTLFKEEYSTWLMICNKSHGPLLKIGDKVKLHNDFQKTKFFDDLGNNTFIVDLVNESKWEHFPCDQYIGLAGVSYLYLNTVLEKK